MTFAEKQLSSEYIHRGKIIRVRVDDVELCDGRKTKREVVEHSGGVAVVPIKENGDVVLVRQYRYPFESELLEIPAGKLEPGEDTRECGVRELEEETGYRADRFEYLGCMYPTTAYLTEKIYLYLARDLTVGCAHPDEGEHLKVETMPMDELLDKIQRDEIHDAKTMVGIMKAKILLDSEK